MAEIVVIHGPNLNLLGQREPTHYGKKTLAEIDCALSAQAESAGHRLHTFQSNAEHQLIERIHQCGQEKVRFIIINPAAFTHTSIAIRDALAAVAIPFIETHLSNIHAREPFRNESLFSDLAVGVISGFGEQSYYMALTAAINYLQEL